MFESVSTNLGFVDREKKTLEFWKENHIFEKSMEQREGSRVYTFYDGPPTANGSYASYQGYDTEVPHHERLLCSAQSRLGHTRSSC